MTSSGILLKSLLAGIVSDSANGLGTRSINPSCPNEQEAVACEDDCFFEQYSCLSSCDSDNRDCITSCNREYTKVRNLCQSDVLMDTKTMTSFENFVSFLTNKGLKLLF